MWWLLLTLAWADGRTGGGDLRLTGPTSGAPGEIVELTLTGGRGEAHLLAAPAVGPAIRSPEAIGAAVIELAQPMGHVSRLWHRGDTAFRVQLPLIGQAAWQIILANGASRASSNPWVVTVRADALPAAASPSGPTAPSPSQTVSAAPTARPSASADPAPSARPSAPQAAPPTSSPAASPGRGGADTADTSR